MLYGWLLANLAGLDSATPSYVGELLDRSGARTPPPNWESAPSIEDAQRHAETALTFSLATTVAFTLYVAAAALARDARGRAAAGIVVAVAALLQLVGTLAPVMLSQDVLSYAVYGRMFALYGANPHVEVPSQYPQDLLYEYVFWKFAPSFYGPLWTLISAGVVRLAGDDVAMTVLLFRAIEAASAVAGTVLVLVALEAIDPRRAVAGAIVFGWNPLLVVEGGLGGHNDVLMATLIALAVALAVRRRGALACTALVVAGLVKFTALALLPLLGLYLLRRAPTWSARAWLVARCAALAAPLVAVIVAPVWAGSATFAVGALGSGSDRYVNSLGELALGERRAQLGESREDLAIPLQFRGWWVALHAEAPLMPSPAEGTEALVQLEQWQELLLVAPERLRWLKVFDPTTRQIGYVQAAFAGPIDRPAWADDDARIVRLEEGPAGTASLQQANRDVRAVGWGAFAVVFCVGLVLGTGTLTALLRTWLLVFLVLFYVTLTWFWPWYALWALPAAALLPRSGWSRLVVWFSWGVLLLYAGLGFQGTNFWYVHTYRALPAFGLPLAIWAIESGVRYALSGAERGFRSSRVAPLSASRRCPAEAADNRALAVSGRPAEGP